MSNVEKGHGVSIEPISFTPLPLEEKIDVSQLILYEPPPIKNDVRSALEIVQKNLGLYAGVALEYPSLESAAAALVEVSNALRNSKSVPHYAWVTPFIDEESGNEHALLRFVHPSHPGIVKQKSEN